MAAPNPPINITATEGDGSALVAFTPGSDNGSAITGYEVVAENLVNPANGGQTASGPTTPILVTGLTNGEGYVFRVTATNADGTSSESDPSNLVIPVDAPETPTGPLLPDAVQVSLTKTVNLVQLTDELTDALGSPVRTAVRQQDFSRPVSADNPAELFVQPDTVNLSTVNSVIAAHVSNPNYGQSVDITEFNAVTQKVIDDFGVVLTDAELATAVKGLLVNMVQARMSGGSQNSLPLLG